MLLRTPRAARRLLQKAIQEARFDKGILAVALSDAPVYEIELAGPENRSVMLMAHLAEVTALRVDVVEPPERTLSRWIETQMAHVEAGDVLVIGCYGLRMDSVGLTFFAGFLDTAE